MSRLAMGGRPQLQKTQIPPPKDRAPKQHRRRSFKQTQNQQENPHEPIGPH